MPDKEGKLTKNEIVKVEQWLKANWKEPKCPISNDNDWVIGDVIIAPPNYTPGIIKVGGDIYPLVMVICKTCGYTIFFNGVLMEIVGSEEKNITEKPDGK